MIQTVEAVVDVNGQVRLLGEVHVDGPRRALVMVLEEPAGVPRETARLAEAVPAGPVVSPESWEMTWRAWAASHKAMPSAAEDDRDSIYAGRGE
jgi:hypothetical protein